MVDSKAVSMLPLQVPPLERRDLVRPHETVDVVNGDPEDLFWVRIYLLHGANYNDPAWFDHVVVERQGQTCCQECSLEATGILPQR